MVENGKKLKIVLIGSRGIPCTYGVFETLAERLSIELVGWGYSVTVCGQNDEGKNGTYEFYKGVEYLNFRGKEDLTEIGNVLC